ncbi:MAG: right-handed parallel beta-helix repeat-containing protein, partial [Planctomycetota bacterium]
MRASAILAPTTLGLLATTALAQTVTNGPGDDTAALQAAIDNATPGSTIQLLAGEYTIGGVGERVLDLRGKAGIMIVGAGAGQTTVRFTGTGDAATADLFDLSGATDLSFADFTLSGGGRTDVDNGFVGFGGSGHTWNNLAITDIAPAGTARTRGFVGAGIFTGGVDDVSITNSTFRNVGNDAQFGAAVRIEDGIGATVADNAITNTGRNGIILKQTSAGTITNNDIRGTGLFRDFANANNIPVADDANGVFNLDGLAIELFSESADANGNLPASLNFDHVVQGNTVDHWISIDRGSNIAVRDNIIDGRGSTLVQLIGLEMAGAGENVIFADNVVRQADPAAGNQYSGLSISNSGPKNNVLVAGNTFDNLEEFGMQLQGNDANDGTGELRRIVVARNTVQNTQREIGGTAANGDFALGDATSDGTGIRMLNAVFDATFIDNIVTNN